MSTDVSTVESMVAGVLPPVLCNIVFSITHSEDDLPIGIGPHNLHHPRQFSPNALLREGLSAALVSCPSIYSLGSALSPLLSSS